MKKLLAVLLTTVLAFSPPAQAAKIRTIPITMSNSMIFYGSIDFLMTSTFMAAAIGKRIMLPQDQTLYIVIVSGGGEYHTAKQVTAFIRELPNTQVICKYCASAAGMVFAASGQKRLVMKNSEFMMHEMYYKSVTAVEIQDPYMVRSLVISSDEFNKILYDMIGISKEEYEKRILNKEWTLNGDHIRQLKLADELVKLDCDTTTKILMPQTCE